MAPIEMSISASSASSSPFTPHWDLYPKSYIAHKTPCSDLLDKLDGDLTKECWNDIPWSDYFDDIRGEHDSPSADRPDSNCQTRFKAIWDDTHLYIGAILHSDFETHAEFHQRNEPIYQKDSDYEVFIDPLGSCHNYKELEVNAINTVWNLMLDRPYADGGSEHSGRVAKPGDGLYYEVYHQKTATRLLKGELNNPREGATWSIEIAVSYKDLLSHIVPPKDKIQPPSIGSMWRINFSRVEKQGDINWTWCPQIVWNPKDRRYKGYVAMHLPDAWGYIVFGAEKKQAKEEAMTTLHPRDPSWPGRLAALNVYYSQKQYMEDSGEYASDINQLQSYVDKPITAPFKVNINTEKENNSRTFLVIVDGNPDGSVVSITDDRYVQVFFNSDDGERTSTS